jgi:osmoprotectant transport system substrate-binding protein
MRRQAMNKNRYPRLAWAATAVVMVFAAAACSRSGNPLAAKSSPQPGTKGQPTVTIGSANFPENEILADIYADVLRDHGVPVTTHLDIGTRELYYPLIEHGQISLIPEYNGSLLEFLDVKSTAASTQAVDQALSSILPHSLEVLDPSPAQDGNALAVTAATAARYHLSTIASLTPVAGQLVIGGPAEFATRSIGLPGLAHSFGMHFKHFIPLDESGPLTIKALEQGTVQVALVFTTTPFITADHLVVLSDPTHYYAAQNVIPLINRAVATPLVVRTLDAVSAKLTTNDVIRLDDEVQNQHLDASVVAQQFVRQAGLS